jgi:hypothetical protein
MKPINAKHGIAFVLLLVSSATSQMADGSVGRPASTAPRLSSSFSRVAVKAILTIAQERDGHLIDEAMINLTAAELTQAERKVVWHVQLFQQIYSMNELISSHAEDQECIRVWIPKLRGLSAEIPAQCPRLTNEELRRMAQP